MNVTIPKGFKIGQAQDDYTGVTVILSEKGAVGGVDCRGGAPGTRETDLLHPEKMMDKVNAVVLTGGSAYGLASCTGVMEYLREKGIGYHTAGKVVPIVSGAVIFDLNQKEYHYPTAETGYKACENADRTPTFGQNGVGKGATVGKMRGLKYACKSGVGAYTVKVAGVNVTAIVAVNALGDVVDPSTGKIVAGTKANDGSFIDVEKRIVSGEVLKMMMGTNTTIGCIVTDAKIDKVTANKIAAASHNGLARTIRPVHTDYDGDTMFCLASGHRPVLNTVLLQTAAVEATEKAILNAVNDGVRYTVLYDDTDEKTDTWQCDRKEVVGLGEVMSYYDGDTMFCLASGHRPVLNTVLLQTAAVEATEKAILNAVNDGVRYTVLYDDTDEKTDTWQCD